MNMKNPTKIVKSMNRDVIVNILAKQGTNGLVKSIHDYNDYRYEQAYRDGYIMGQGIGYQDGKYDGYAQAVKQIMKAK